MVFSSRFSVKSGCFAWVSLVIVNPENIFTFQYGTSVTRSRWRGFLAETPKQKHLATLQRVNLMVGFTINENLLTDDR